MTYEEAIDEIQTMLSNAWSQTGFDIYYESVREDRETGLSPWAVCTIRHTSGGQTTLGGTSYREFMRRGIMIVQVFTPIGNGLQESYRLAKVITDAYEGKSSPSGVWFRRVRINEVGKDGMFQQLNVVVEFEYNEVK